MEVEVQTGTRNVALDGDYIAGMWDEKGAVYRLGERRAIALDVLNLFLSSDRLADAALDFTRRFGPLTAPFSGGEPFRFSIEEWKMARKYLHGVWKAASGGAERKWPFNIPVDGSGGDRFSGEDGRLVFRTQNLSTFMALEIAAVPVEKFRRCANFMFGCKAPFFFASDLRERYCSESCAREGKNRAKREWWNKNRGGGRDGAQKTR